MLKKEWIIFLHALQFYTRITCRVNYSDDYLNQSSRYFPLIGLLVGGITALVFQVSLYVLPIPIAVLLSMLTSILVTGAFHEDGLADVCDGFGGGWSKEHIITIMKDSRIGAYGVIGLLFTLSFKYILLVYLALQLSVFNFILILLAGHSISRFFTATFLLTHVYVNDATVNAKAKPIATKKLSVVDLSIAGLFCIIPMGLFPSYMLFISIIPLFLVKIYLGYWFKKWIGGYTGDCLGATQQITEIVFYLSILILWKFI